MKYGFLLQILRLLVYVKRVFWWLGAKFYLILAKISGFLIKPILFVHYKIQYALKRVRSGATGSWFLDRGFLQLILFLFLAGVGINETNLVSKKNLYHFSQRTLVYTLTGSNDVNFSEEILAEPTTNADPVTPAWREGVVGGEIVRPSGAPLRIEGDLATTVAGGSAVSKPLLLPGSTVGGMRTEVVEYVIEPGDSLGGIAYQFGVSIPTILWENNLTLRSIIRPGGVLRIPPVTGIMHTVKKGDTIKKIAAAYEAEAPKIITFNNLKEDGTDLKVGERVMVPDGIKPVERAIARVPIRQTTVLQRAAPPNSSQRASTSGFVWPSGVRTITQYFGLRHHALDIAGPWQTPTYASKAGTVEKSQCGWNSGYGCYIIIDHGGGVKTLYGHHSKLLVSPGDYVEAGQTIGLMGNTGRVYGRTGIHVHFEIIVNGARVNPLGYLR